MSLLALTVCHRHEDMSTTFSSRMGAIYEGVNIIYRIWRPFALTTVYEEQQANQLCQVRMAKNYHVLLRTLSCLQLHLPQFYVSPRSYFLMGSGIHHKNTPESSILMHCKCVLHYAVILRVMLAAGRGQQLCGAQLRTSVEDSIFDVSKTLYVLTVVSTLDRQGVIYHRTTESSRLEKTFKTINPTY